MTDERRNPAEDELPRPRPGRAVGLEMRGRAVAAVVHGGMSAAAAARQFGLGASSVRRWVRQFRERGHVQPGKQGGCRPSQIEPERGAHFPHPGGPAGAYRAGIARCAGRRRGVVRHEHGAKLPETPQPGAQTPPPPQAAAGEEGVAALLPGPAVPFDEPKTGSSLTLSSGRSLSSPPPLAGCRMHTSRKGVHRMRPAAGLRGPLPPFRRPREGGDPSLTSDAARNAAN